MSRAIVAVLLLAFACVAFAGCGTSERPGQDGGAIIDEPIACTVAAPTECPDPAPRYADIAPILSLRCVGPCHSGVPEGPWPLTDYAHVADWADVVRADLLDCSMPPPDGGTFMTDEERLAVLVWIRCGFYE